MNITEQHRKNAVAARAGGGWRVVHFTMIIIPACGLMLSEVFVNVMCVMISRWMSSICMLRLKG